jgi:hypothetical protein
MINKETASEYAKVIMMPEYGMSKDDEGFEDTYKKLGDFLYHAAHYLQLYGELDLTGLKVQNKIGPSNILKQEDAGSLVGAVYDVKAPMKDYLT